MGTEGRLTRAATRGYEGTTASTAFTPGAESGTVEVTFTIDASGLSGHRLVAFERVSWEGHVVATHEDLEDEGQTMLVEKPKAPESPTTPRTLSKTGDDTCLGPFVAAMAANGAALVALGVSALRRRRREWDEEDLGDDCPHIRRERVIQVMPDLGRGEEAIP